MSFFFSVKSIFLETGNWKTAKHVLRYWPKHFPMLKQNHKKLLFSWGLLETFVFFFAIASFKKCIM